MPAPKSKDHILQIAREILASHGMSAVSFDAIARQLGRSKQAVLYWYPNKHDLLAAMFLPWLEAVAEVAARSVLGTEGRGAAIAAFVRAIAEFHFENLDRFRVMYLVLQTIPQGPQDPHDARLLDQVHPVADKIYGALASHLDGDNTAARREAVAIHAAVLGLVLLSGLADSLNDPLKHGSADLVDALVASFLSA